MTHEQKIELLHKAIDAIMDAVNETDIDAHYFLNSENSVVSRLNSEVKKLEEELSKIELN